MVLKVVFIILASLVFQASSLSLHLDAEVSCYANTNELKTTPSFNYTITNSWTQEQQLLIINGQLNASDFVHVSGWEPYSTPIQFFEDATKESQEDLNYHIYNRKVHNESNVLKFKISDADLQQAFGNSSQANIYKVPDNFYLLVMRFQSKFYHLPSWNVILGIVVSGAQDTRLEINKIQFDHFIANTNLTSQQMAGALNMNPASIEKTILWSIGFKDSILKKGTVEPVHLQPKLVLVRDGEYFLAGPINGGQPNITQAKIQFRIIQHCKFDNPNIR